MKTNRLFRHTVVGTLLFLGVCWSLSVAGQEQRAREAMYPNDHLLASAEWLLAHKDDPNLMIVDVRTDEYYEGECIPGAVRLPWREFRHNNVGLNLGSVFVGIERAQEILGRHGIQPSDTVVLYDSVERDGGATASYVFWILDLMGHGNVKILDGGIDAWRKIAATGEEPAAPEPVLYQADPAVIRPRLWADGEFIESRLGDPYYQIIDVRSEGEYLGDVGNKDLNGNPLKLGHIPTAVNIPYDGAWVDEETKLVKPYQELRELYRGISTGKAVVAYCHSGRRSSFTYFILRLMGFNDVIEYEGSWNQWGSYRNFFPVELEANRPAGDALPGTGDGGEDSQGAEQSESTPRKTSSTPSASGGGEPSGYVSCGG